VYQPAGCLSAWLLRVLKGDFLCILGVDSPEWLLSYKRSYKIVFLSFRRLSIHANDQEEAPSCKMQNIMKPKESILKIAQHNTIQLQKLLTIKFNNK
jgi:hypothetical protein